MPALERIQIAGFKSIREQDLELGSLNVLIGANGAGKSNFVGVFELLHQLVNKNLQLFVAKSGGADQLLHYGSKTTAEMNLHFYFGPNEYSCELIPTRDDSLVFGREAVYYLQPQKYETPFNRILGKGHKESVLRDASKSTRRRTIEDFCLRAFSSWQAYHFHDTSASAKIKLTGDLDDNRVLRPDASNLAAYLYMLQETQNDVYRNIVDVLRMVAPFFDDFDLQPDRLNPEKIKLVWREKGSDAYFNGHALSDGTLRFISLATLLLQPELPSTVLLDEPELGLHPYAISVLSDLLRAASKRTQVIVSTQSVTLVNQLTPEDLIVVDRLNGESSFRRLTEEEISSWLDDYALGELWEKNLLGGRPGP